MNVTVFDDCRNVKPQPPFNGKLETLGQIRDFKIEIYRDANQDQIDSGDPAQIGIDLKVSSPKHADVCQTLGTFLDFGGEFKSRTKIVGKTLRVHLHLVNKYAGKSYDEREGWPGDLKFELLKTGEFREITKKRKASAKK